MEASPLHATLIAARRDGRWRGALIRGRSGSGKSGLALQALSHGWRLVADDRVTAWASGTAAYGAPPVRLAGLIEVRGLGVISVPHLAFARLALVVEAEDPPGERVPERTWTVVEGVRLPAFRLRFHEVGAVLRLDLALDVALQRRCAL